MQKSRILVKIIEQENPASGIIFCNTKADVHFVATVLRRFGYDVGEISADLSQGAREEVLEKLRQNKLKFLVATDVAARGIDIHELSHVFQYQPPQDHEAYVHRTGRTGRAGAAGVAISFVSGMEEIELDQIAKKFSIVLEERQVPADEELELLISQRAVFLLEARLRSADNIQKERMQRFVRTVTDLAANEDSRALLAMLVDDFYQKTFHAPLEQPSEKLIDVPRPVQVQPHSVPPQPASSEKPEGEKRRRKRNRKKPSAGTENSVKEQGVGTAVVEAEESRSRSFTLSAVQSNIPPVTVERAQVPVAPVSHLDAPVIAEAESVSDAFDGGLESIWDEPETAVPAESVGTPSKKRRRRRPRKNGASRPDTGGDKNIVPSPVAPESSAELPVKPGASSAGSVSREGRSEQRPNPQAEPRKSPDPKSRNRGAQQDAVKPVPAPAKTKKKIFLE